ncbi:hematopoietic progenitor cell antigen CD34 [Erethizon dorsatum]
MLARRSARAGRGVPWGCAALCLLSLLREYGAARAPGSASRRAGARAELRAGSDPGDTHAHAPPPAHGCAAATRASPGDGGGGREGTATPAGDWAESLGAPMSADAAPFDCTVCADGLAERGPPFPRFLRLGSCGLTLACSASGFTNDSPTTGTTERSTSKLSSPVPTNVSHQESTTPVTPRSITTQHGSVDSMRPTANISDTTVFTTTEFTTAGNTSASNVTSRPGTPPVNVSDDSPTNTTTTTTTTSPVMTSPTKLFTSSSAPSAIKGEIKCAGIKEVKLTHSICLELNKTYSCEDFKKDKGEDLIQLLCGKEEADAVAGATTCSLLLAQSEVKPQCLLMVLANSTELSRKSELLKKHQSDLEKLGIQSFQEQDVGSHQSYSRKTLIALVTSGILLAILGTTGYFLMNRRSWSPTGERLGEDPYYTENSGGQGYSSGPGASSEAQGKASVNRGAQENGTGQATSRNGHSARQHVADTEL